MKAVIDRGGCISCGLCEELCPEVFRIGDDGLAEVHGEITKGAEEGAKGAEEACPVSVIYVE